MNIFQDIELEWQGQRYTIPAKRVMGAIACIEDVVTLVELQRYGARENMPMAKLAMAYAAVLRYAGAKVEAEEVYAGMFGTGKEQAVVLQSIVALLEMMLPRRALPGPTETQRGNSRAPAPAGAAARLSKKPTRPRSAKAAG